MTFESNLCPFCKKNNKCEVLKPASCWCMKTKIPEELKLLVPTLKKNKSCICESCVENFKKDPNTFKTKYTF